MSYVNWNGMEMKDSEWDNMKRDFKERLTRELKVDATLEIELYEDTLNLIWDDVKSKEHNSFSAMFIDHHDASVAKVLSVEFCKELAKCEDGIIVDLWSEDNVVFVAFKYSDNNIHMISGRFFDVLGAFSAGSVLRKVYDISKGYALCVRNLGDPIGDA